MTPAIREPEIKPQPKGLLDAPRNATRTTDYEIPREAWEAYVSALDRADDLAIALEIRLREPSLNSDPVELEDFMREQGYDPADFEA